MPYVSRREASRLLGITEKSLMRRRQRGTAGVIAGPNGEYMFWVSDSVAGISPPPEVSRPLFEGADAEDQARYTFDRDKDTYTFPIRGSLHKVSGAKVRWLCEHYSTEGGGLPVAACARQLGWAVGRTEKVLKLLNHRHSSPPFAPEQVSQLPEEELIASALRKKEARVQYKVRERRQAQTEAAARKWADVESAIEEVFADLSLAPLKVAARPAAPAAARTAITWHTDTHVGRMSWGRDIDACRSLVIGSLRASLERASAHAPLGRILLPVGSDWYDIDTWSKTTTRGTPQESVHPRDVIRWGNTIMVDKIRTAAEFAPVTVIPVPGNHDRLLTHAAASWLGHLFPGGNGIDVLPCKSRHYIECGQNLFMFAHGDGAKASSYPSIMAHEAREAWGRTAFHWALHGHYHHLKVQAMVGAVVRQLGAFAPSDDYHDLHGYVGVYRTLRALLFHDRYGADAEFPVYATREGELLL